MVVWAVWQPASWIPLLLLVSTETVSVWTTILVSSNRFFVIISSLPSQMTGLRTRAGWSALAKAIRFHLLTSIWHQPFMTLMCQVTKQRPRTACASLTWTQLTAASSEMGLILTRQISWKTWPSSSTQMIQTVKGNCSVFSNNTSWSPMQPSWFWTKLLKRAATFMIWQTMQSSKSTIPTHLWLFQKWFAFWQSAVSA